MRLQYRGTSYEYNVPSLDVRETDVFRPSRDASQRCKTVQRSSFPLTYRGVQYTTDQVAAALSAPVARHSAQPLIYRGARYLKNTDGTVDMVAVTSGRDRVVIPQTTATLLKEVSRVHQDNMRRNLERRLQAAQQRGDQTLISLLEAESKQLAS